MINVPKKQRIKKQRVMSASSSEHPSYLYSILFSVDATLINESKPNTPIQKITSKHIDAIVNSVHNNARRNFHNQIFTDNDHIVKLMSCKLENITRNNLFTFRINLEVDASGMLPDDLVYAVFPSAYDNTNAYHFIFEISSAKKSTYYTLIMNDVPTILQFDTNIR